MERGGDRIAAGRTGAEIFTELTSSASKTSFIDLNRPGCVTRARVHQHERDRRKSFGVTQFAAEDERSIERRRSGGDRIAAVALAGGMVSDRSAAWFVVIVSGCGESFSSVTIFFMSSPVMPLPPPGAKGTISSMGRSGKAARADEAVTANAAAARVRPTTLIRFVMTILVVDYGQGALRVDFWESIGRIIAGLIGILSVLVFAEHARSLT
jgi:hypothetical protein